MNHDTYSTLSALTQDQLDQLVFSAREEITRFENDMLSGSPEPEQYQKVFETAFSLYMILTQCKERTGFFSDFILKLDQRKVFRSDSEEYLLCAYVRLNRENNQLSKSRRLMKSMVNLPVLSEGTAFPETAAAVYALKQQQSAVNEVIQSIVRRTKASAQEQTAERNETKEKLMQEYSEIAHDLKTASQRCPSFLCDHIRLNILLSLCSAENEGSSSEDKKADLFDELLDEALGVYSFWQNSAFLRLYAQIMISAIEYDLDLGMNTRAKERFEKLRRMIDCSPLIIRDPQRCVNADAELLYEMYVLYRKLYEHLWTLPSRLRILEKTGEYAERSLRLCGILKPYIQIKSEEYTLRMQPAVITTRQEALEALIYFESELEKQWVLTPPKAVNKLVRQLHIYKNLLIDMLEQEEGQT